jgi:hypothetical protein
LESFNSAATVAKERHFHSLGEDRQGHRPAWTNRGAIVQAIFMRIPRPTSYQQRSKHMAKRLSEQLAELSVRVKRAEDAATAAEKEAHDKIAARKEQARAAATTAVEKVRQEVNAVSDNAARDWNSVKAKIASDVAALKADVAEAKHDRDVKHADNRADRLEREAGFAIDYAIASVAQAQLAVLDAIDGRVQAEQSRRA